METNTLTIVDDILEHHGVKGQKWGTRRARKAEAKIARKNNKPGSRKYDSKNLSNEELKRVVARMKLEQEYASLNQKSNVKSERKKYTEDLLKNAGKVLFAAAVTEVGVKQIRKAMDKDVAKSAKQVVKLVP